MSSQPAGPPVNLLFYSNRCMMSKHLIVEMNKEGILQYFQRICVDDNPRIPPGMNTFPAIIAKGNPKVFAASEAFGWFAMIKQQAHRLRMRNMTEEQSRHLGAIDRNLSTHYCSLLGYASEEMGSSSDNYSFYNHNIQLESQEALPQFYFPCVNLGKDSILTPPLPDGSFTISEKSKPTAKDFEAQLAAASRARMKEETATKSQLAKFHESYS